MDAMFVEMLGFVAGATTLFSSVPQLLANLRDPDLARGQSAARNALQGGGNAMWLLYALSVGSIAMTTFASLGSLMALALLTQTLRIKGEAAQAASPLLIPQGFTSQMPAKPPASFRSSHEMPG